MKAHAYGLEISGDDHASAWYDKSPKARSISIHEVGLRNFYANDILALKLQGKTNETGSELNSFEIFGDLARSLWELFNVRKILPAI